MILSKLRLAAPAGGGKAKAKGLLSPLFTRSLRSSSSLILGTRSPTHLLAAATTTSTVHPNRAKFASTSTGGGGGNHGDHHHNHNYPPFHRESLKGEFGSYIQAYDRSIQDPERFWADAASSLHWFEEPTQIIQQDMHNPYFYRYFPDGKINTSYNCLDVHVNAGRGEQPALIYDSPVTDTKQILSYDELLEQVSIFAGALQNELGVVPGDRVVIYMPMIPQAIVAMLACTRIGAVHNVVFGGFASHELATRIDDSKPKVVIAASGGVEPTHIVHYKPLLEKALEICHHSVEKVVVVQRPAVEEAPLGPNDIDYDDLMKKAKPVDAVPLAANHPHYVLYTSGTTGLPKGVVRDTAGYAVSLKYSMDHFYGMTPGDIFWAASDIGWVVGHSYIVYAPLLHGCATVLYEGKPVGTPDAGAFWRVISEYRVKAMFTAPTAFRVMKQADPDAELAKQYDLSCMETLFVAGEHCDPETLHWCEKALPHVPPPIDHWWQTELGGPAVGNAVGLGRCPVRYGSCSMPVPGYEIDILDDNGNKAEPNQLGHMAIKAPLPPGTMATIFNHDQRYIDYFTKFPGYYETGDAAYIDDDGYIYIMGRTDDVINTAGHRLSTGNMEEVLMEHPKVADCAVIAVKDEIKGQIPAGLVICVGGTTEDEYETIKKELIALVREEIGPVASFKKVGIVQKLPKTRSGKILRGTMSQIANGEPYKITPTVEDANVFDYLEPEIQKLMEK